MTDLERIIAEMRESIGWCGEDDVPKEDVTEWADRLAALAGAAPVAWRVRIGASDMWGYCASECEADFYGKQSGLNYEKQPLFTHAPAKAREDWQPMETAPKDGRWIVLGWSSDTGVICARWSREHNDWMDSDCDIGFHFPPTHWTASPYDAALGRPVTRKGDV